MRREVIFPKQGEFFQSQMDESHHLEEIMTWEHSLWYDIDQFKALIVLENQKGLFHNFKIHFRMPVKLWTFFCPMSQRFIYRHHVEPRVKLYSPREESFLIPPKYIDVTRITHTNLDVRQEKRVDDYCNIDSSRDLSDPWTGFTQFTQVEEKAPDGYTWSGVRLTRKQLTSRPDHLWPELWKSMGKHAKLKEKQKWSEEKIHF